MSTLYHDRYEQLFLQLYSLTYKNNEFKQQEVANLLMLSPKQLSRYLKRLEEDGYVKYQAGKGRTIKSRLIWMEAATKHLLKLLATYEMHLIEWLVEWLNSIKEPLIQQEVTAFLQQHIIEPMKQMQADHLIIQMYQPILSIHPIHANDFYSVSMVHNLYNRLVRVEGQQFTGDLAIDWEIDEQSILFHIRRNVLFHNGTELNAYHVAQCFDRNAEFLQHYNCIDIQILSPYRIAFTFNKPCSKAFLLAIFAQSKFFIFLEQDSQIYGTGPFQLSAYNPSFLQLVYFPAYFSDLAMLKKVTFLQVPRSVERNIQMSSTEQILKHKKITNKETYLLMNPNSRYFRSRPNREQFVKQWVEDEINSFIENSTLNIGVSAHKKYLKLQLKQKYEKIYPKINWLSLAFEDYVRLGDWSNLDAIMVTQSFIETQDALILGELLNGESIFSKLYPELSHHYFEQFKTNEQILSPVEFFKALSEHYLLIPLQQQDEYILVGEDIVLKEGTLLSNLKDVWRKY